MKYLKSFTTIVILGLLYTSCVKKENYPDVPVITFNSFTFFGSGTTTDSALLRVNFTDGNGAIGYPAGQEGAPNDFFVRPMLYYYSTKTFLPIIIDTSGNNDTLTYPYAIPDITPVGSDKELNGIIQINLENAIQGISYLATDLAPYANVSEYQFQVWMYDRNGNKSNILITPTQVNPYH